MKIAVVGGTGLIGRHVVEVLRAGGTEAVSLSRSSGVDVITGAGLDEALSGVHRVIDVTNSPTTEQGPATAFFTAAAQQLQRAAQGAGVERLVVLSIVGTDRLSSGYLAAKREHERAAQSGRVPAVVLRCTQFHEFAEQVLEWGRQADVSRVQERRVQPVAVVAAARVLADVALARDLPPPVSEVAGPRVESLVDMATRLAARRADPVQVQGFREDSPDAAAVATGALLPGPHAVLTGPTFQQWLDAGEQVPSPSGTAASAG
ncbi:MAG: SDR family oxidoreductase [Actinomycetota bacterium]|nr:SDR family oxidoreductase [Actinomycetota bacterium]